MFASLRCLPSRLLSCLAAVVGGVLLAGVAEAAITVTGGTTSPGIPPLGVGQSFDAGGPLLIGQTSTPAIVTVDRTSVLAGTTIEVGSATGAIGQVSVSNRGARLVGTSGVLVVGAQGSGTVEASDGAVVDFAGAVSLGTQVTGVGRVAVTDPGTALLASNGLTVGEAGAGDFELANGALASVAVGGLSVGTATTGFGLARITDPGTQLILGTELQVGSAGNGEFELSGGALATVPQGVTVGSAAAGVGLAKVTGTGSRLIAGSGLLVGSAGNGGFEVSNGALASFGQNVTLGSATTGIGLATITGAGSRLIAGGGLEVGVQGDAELEVSDGGLVSLGNDFTVSSRFGGAGVAVIEGAGSRVTTSTSAQVGDFGYGELYLSDGGSMNVAGNFEVGGSGGIGSVSVSGQRTTLSLGGVMRIGGSPRSFNNNAGGTLTIADRAIVDSQGQSAVSVLEDGRIELNDGTLLATATDVEGVLSGGGTVFGAVEVMQTGRVEVHEGQRLQFATRTDIAASGDFLLAGGSLNLQGMLVHDTGDITLRDGALLDTAGTVSTGTLAATSGVSDVYGTIEANDVLIAQDTTLVFHDTLTITTGAATIQNGGSLVTLDNVMTMPAVALSMALGEAGDPAPISVGGEMTLAGSLTVGLSAEVEATAEVGDVFELIDAASLAGGFDRYELPTLSGNRWLAPVLGETSLALAVVAQLPGDFNLDGIVDAADYTVLRDGLGSTYTAQDAAAWAAYYGTTLPGPATSVPEPTGVAILLLGLAAGAGFRRAA